MSEYTGAIELLIDGTSTRKLTSGDLKSFSLSCVDAIGMTIIHGPNTYRIRGTDWHCHTVIAESHVTVETEGKHVHIDIFSCKPFSMQGPRDLAITILGMSKGMHVQKIQRAGPASSPT